MNKKNQRKILLSTFYDFLFNVCLDLFWVFFVFEGRLTNLNIILILSFIYTQILYYGEKATKMNEKYSLYSLQKKDMLFLLRYKLLIDKRIEKYIYLLSKKDFFSKICYYGVPLIVAFWGGRILILTDFPSNIIGLIISCFFAGGVIMNHKWIVKKIEEKRAE